MARDLGVLRLDVRDREPGKLDLRAWTREPLLGVRSVDHDRYPLRIARCESGGNLVLDLVNAAGHVAVQGATGSGKSTTVYGLLASVTGRPDAEVWGLDPTGILLDAWEGQPGRRALGLADVDDHVTVAAAAVAEMDQRIARLRERGLDKIEPSPDMPALIMVLEEWPGELKALKDADAGLRPDGRREPKVRAAVSRLIAEGRKVGIRVLMLAQRFDAAIIGGAERSNIAYRITHRVDNADAVRMLHESATPELIVMAIGDPGVKRPGFEPGEALYQGPGGLPEKIKVDVIDYAAYRARVCGAAARVRG